MQPFGLKHENRVIIDLQAYKTKAKKGDDATGEDGLDDVSKSPTSLEIIITGVWDTPYHGAFAITDSDLQLMIDNWRANLRNGLPIDYEHDDDGGAAGWLDNLRIAQSSADPSRNALWGDVKWTPAAEQAIKDGEYRYFSPEFYVEDYCDPMTGDTYDMVLIGGGLTNRPLMRDLAPVMANDTIKSNKKVLTANSKQHSIYVRKANTTTMNLETLLAKAPAELSAEEKAFIIENKADLTEEQTTTLTEAGVLEAEGDADDSDAGNDGEEASSEEEAGSDEGEEAGTQASEKGKIVMSQADVDVLKRQASEGAKAMGILERKSASEKIAGLVYNKETGGKFPTTASEKLTDLFLGLDTKQRKLFDEIVGLMPNARALFETAGADSKVSGGAVDEVQTLISEKMKANEKLTHVQAMRIVAKENPTLIKQYHAEVEGR